MLGVVANQRLICVLRLFDRTVRFRDIIFSDPSLETCPRPDLLRAMVLRSPFLDVLTSMIQPNLPLTIHEYEEWGDPSVRVCVVVWMQRGGL